MPNKVNTIAAAWQVRYSISETFNLSGCGKALSRCCPGAPSSQYRLEKEKIHNKKPMPVWEAWFKVLSLALALTIRLEIFSPRLQPYVLI